MVSDCQVVAVGGGRKKEDSEEWITPNVTVGQTVMYSKYSGTEFEVRCSIPQGGEWKECIPQAFLAGHESLILLHDHVS